MTNIKGQELISSTQVRGHNTQSLTYYYIHRLNSLTGASKHNCVKIRTSEGQEYLMVPLKQFDKLWLYFKSRHIYYTRGIYRFTVLLSFQLSQAMFICSYNCKNRHYQCPAVKWHIKNL